MKITFKSWATPNFATPDISTVPRQDGWNHLQAIHVRDIPAEDLAALCDRFRADVFSKAGQIDPATKPQEGGTE